MSEIDFIFQVDVRLRLVEFLRHIFHITVVTSGRNMDKNIDFSAF